MKTIKKIKIKKFRSIRNKEIALGDITIFSGKNNSGKSNILRALNLFFNDQASFGQDYEHERDYNAAYTGDLRGKREIEISLHFAGFGNGALSKDFHITRRFQRGSKGSNYEYSSDNPDIQNKIKKQNGTIIGQFNKFMNRTKFYYVPAVRDKSYVKTLLLSFEELLEGEDKDFKGKISDLSGILNAKSEAISRDFKNFLNLPANASLSTSITDILGAIVINVQSGIKIERKSKEGRTHPITVDLFSSGDGVLMSYIPHFLAYISNKISKKNFIWGFEEPENSLEYSKVQDLSEKFYKDFSKNAQILITTHSPAFIKLKDKEEGKDKKNVAFYRVYIDPDDPTQESKVKTIKELEEKQIGLFPKGGEIETKEYELLEREIGFVEMSNDIAEYLEKWREEKKTKQAEINELEDKLKDSFPEKVFICEDSEENIVKLWKNWLSEIEGIDVRTSGGCDNNNLEIVFQEKIKERPDYKPKIFRQIDRDGYTEQQISIIEDEKAKKYRKYFDYKVKFLPVYELENFALLSSEDDFRRLIEENNYDLEDKFSNTIEDKLLKQDRYFKRKKTEFHNVGDNKTKIRVEMRRNKIRLLNGKEIAKLKPNFSPLNILSKLEHHNQPQELKDYLNEVKNFFQQDG